MHSKQLHPTTHKELTMPYIAKEDRKEFEFFEKEVEASPPKTAGELQYMIAILIREMFNNTDKRYQNCNDIMGALAGAQMEFYRRKVAPYEDVCINKNGDV
jgi:hypothetical protein